MMHFIYLVSIFIFSYVHTRAQIEAEGGVSKVRIEDRCMMCIYDVYI
jgi:hypothetical protein